MKTIRSLFQVITSLTLLLSLFGTITPVHAAGTTITVDTIEESLTVNGNCDIREAVQAATTNLAVDNCPAGNAIDTDTIAFSIGSGPQTITLTSSLVINGPVILDGTSQPGYTNAPIIRIDGGNANLWGVYFNSASDGSSAKGLMITRFGYGQLVVSGSDNFKALGNYIGTDGSSDLGGNIGIILEGSDNATVGGAASVDRNVIAGNATDVELDAGASGNNIQGNYIGVYTDGSSTPASGSSYGISITFIPSANTGGPQNFIGGLNAGEGNVIAGHSTAEISIASSDNSFSDNNSIQGNIIGLDATGAAAVSMTSGDGIRIINSDNTLIEKNIISGKNGMGISLSFDNSFNPGGGTPIATDGTIIKGNKIGTDIIGTVAKGNGIGISVDVATNTTIGGVTFANSNLIASNTQYGIYVSGSASTGTTVSHNLIGWLVGTSSYTPAGNGSGGVGEGNISVNNSAAPLVTDNWIANAKNNGLFFDNSATLASGSTANCIESSVGFGSNQAYSGGVIPVVDLSGNWWGDASGPTHAGNPTGTGDDVTDNVNYSGFLTSPPVACSPFVDLNLSSIDFGDQLAGSNSSVRTVTLTNTGSKLMTISSIVTLAPFTLLGTGTCPVAGGILKSGEVCTIKVRFSPKTTGAASQDVTITSDASTSPDLIALSGTGVAGTQLLKNPSFEADVNKDKKPDQWTLANFNPVTDLRDCTVKKTGNCSLKLVGNNKKKIASQSIMQSGNSGDDFVVTIWNKSSAVPGSATYHVQVKFYNGSTIFSIKTLNMHKGTHDFERVNGTFTAPGAYTKVLFKVVFNSPSGSAWLDTASLKWAP